MRGDWATMHKAGADYADSDDRYMRRTTICAMCRGADHA